MMRRPKAKLLALGAILFFTGPLYGGHCKYLSAKYAAQAFELLRRHGETSAIAVVDRYCEECLDSYVRPLVVERLEYRPHHVKGYAAIAINGEVEDLAYLYLNGINLARQFRCAVGVSPLYLLQSESPQEAPLGPKDPW